MEEIVNKAAEEEELEGQNSCMRFFLNPYMLRFYSHLFLDNIQYNQDTTPNLRARENQYKWCGSYILVLMSHQQISGMYAMSLDFKQVGIVIYMFENQCNQSDN